MNEKLILKRFESQGLYLPKTDVLEVLRQTVGIQAQSQKEAELNLFLRTENLTLDHLQTLYRKHQIVRSWANRWTLHLLTYDDWELIINARQNEILPRGYYQGQTEISLEIIQYLAEKLATHKKLLKSECIKLVASDFPTFDFHGYAFNGIIQQLTQSGIAYIDASSSVRNHQLIFAEQFKTTSAKQAIETLIKRYWDGFGPAKLEDFIKWSGIKISDVRPIWNTLELPLIITDKTMSDSTFVTARFDSLLTGYADKTWLTPVDKIKLMWTKNGILLAPIIFQGELVGRWSIQTSDKACRILIEHWSPFEVSLFEKKWLEIAHFLGKKLEPIEIIEL
ncbi:DNA glycosylase AlkZ-like family protein [Lactococcus fujiensis]|uniref:Winged helix DNA-binding domain-containing protein n=1 Tax=Lactococcus fujiensis JCM 16395 TaxID=1291764 RepID=A0A2A5RJ90_9LACT|nr:crosslink repair DNA glycosylase YcaQ family protein [Lactococcus fujiensis]PCR99236.1 hypothetical protein RT41_GL000427 [Lactococcus fujiensis JCM 16395]